MSQMEITTTSVVPRIEKILNVTIKSDVDNNVKSIDMIIGKKYTITFYNTKTNSYKTVNGVLVKIIEDGRALDKSYILINVYAKEGNIDRIDQICIPLYNIRNVEETSEKVLTVVLGISAEFVKAISINLKLIYDDPINSTKDISMTTGNTYNITYVLNGTVYEVRGKLIKIDETIPSCSQINIAAYESIVREHVGMFDCPYRSVNDFLSDNNIMTKDADLIFDTSIKFEGDTQKVRLSTIRNVELISEDIGEGEDIEPTTVANRICQYSQNVGEVKLLNGNTARINYETGSVTVDGEESTDLANAISLYYGF